MALTNAQGKLALVNAAGNVVLFPVAGNKIKQQGSTTATFPITTSGLISWWRFNNTLNDTALTDAGVGALGNNGLKNSGTFAYLTSESGFEPTTGVNGVTLSDQDVNIQLAPALGTNAFQTNQWTWEFRWKYPGFAADGGSQNEIITSGTTNDWSVHVQDSQPTEFNLIVHTTSSTGNFFTTGSQVNPTNTLAHIAITYDGSNVKFYKNNSLTNTFSQTGTMVYTATTGNFFSRGDGVNACPAGTKMDYIRLYNRALSAGEISTNYSSGI